jgi:hypothetical protein
MKLKSEYPHSLQLYSVPPSETIGLQELEDWAVERLKGIIALIWHNFLITVFLPIHINSPQSCRACQSE